MMWFGEIGAKERRRTRVRERRRLTRSRAVEAPTDPPKPKTNNWEIGTV